MARRGGQRNRSQVNKQIVCMCGHGMAKGRRRRRHRTTGVCSVYMDDGSERALHDVAPVPKFHIWKEKTSRPMDKPNNWEREGGERSHKLHQQRPPRRAHVQGRRAAAAAATTRALLP